MKKDPFVFLEHIIDCIELIETYTKGKKLADFENDPQLQDAVIRRIEIIGEAAKSVPENLKQKYSKVPWKAVAGMRDILIHQYFGVSLESTWNVVVKEIPGLKKQILQIINDLRKSK